MFTGVIDAQRKVEKLGRGVVAINKGGGSVYVSWRLHATDPEDIAFNVYRKNGSTIVKLNSDPITTSTGYTDTKASTSTANTYYVKSVINGVEVETSGSFTVAGSSTGKSYISLPLHDPPAHHSVHHIYPADLNGDGELDYIVKLLPSTPYGNVFLDAYLNNGSFLWRIDLGRNMEQGASTHNPFVLVYDFDCDGKAEVFTRTAETTTFSDGTTIGDVNADGVTDYRTFPPSSAMGYMLLGDNCPEFISMVDGMTGKEICRREWIDRGAKSNWTKLWGDNYGHRMNMNFVGVAYLDGVHPSIVTSRGDGGVMDIEAYDYSNKTFTSRWTWTARTNSALPSGKTWKTFHSEWLSAGAVYSGIPSGYHWADFHNIRVADLDGDGKDEVSWGVNAMDDNGTPLYFAKTDIGHGDRFQISDLNPDRPGLECYAIQQAASALAVLYDAGTGERIKTWSSADPFDVSRGDAGDVDPRYTGSELWSFAHSTLIQSNGRAIVGSGHPYPSLNIWWDGDLMRENLHAADGDGYNSFIQKWHYETNSTWDIIRLFNEGGSYSTKIPYGCRPALYADVLGDWREEIFAMSGDSSEIRIFSTSTPTDYRVYCLMENPEYRTCANIKGYQTSTQVDYYLGTGMTTPPMPPVLSAKSVWKGGTNNNAWDIATSSNWTVKGVTGTYTDGDTVMFDISGAANYNVNLSSAVNPGWLIVNAPCDYYFSGSGGIAGSTALLKSGSGSLSISAAATYSGKTRIDRGALYVNSNLVNSPVTLKHEAYIGGSGTISQPVTFEIGSGIAPGAKGEVGTLTFAKSVSLPAKSKIKIDFSLSASDQIVINGDFSIADTCVIDVTELNGVITAGTYTLVSYSGNFSGNLSKIGVTGIIGQKYTLANSNNVITITVQDPRAAATAYWTGAIDNVWDFLTTENWSVKGNAESFSKNDTVVFDATGSAQNVVSLSGMLPVGKVIVNGSTDYTLAGSGELTGTGGLYKSGTGKLVISGAHSYKGAVSLSGGTVTIGSLANAGNNSSLGASSSVAPANIQLSNTKLIYTGSEETYTDRGFTLTGNDTIHNTNGALSITGVIAGTGKLVKTGAGTMMLKTGVNTFTGGVVIKEGRLSLGDETGNNNGLGTGSLTLEGGTFSMYSNEDTYTYFTRDIIVPAGALASFITDARCFLTKTLTGAGTLNVYLTPLNSKYGAVRTYFQGDWSAFTGTINITTSSLGGTFAISNTSGYAKSTINCGLNVTFSGSGTIAVGALSGVSESYVSTANWTVGAKNTDATFAGVISSNTVTKVGTGIWTLSGANTYTGATTVSAGTLNITGSLANTAVTVNSGATLAGTGSIAGATTINGIVSPGDVTATSSVGTLTVSNSVTLGSGSTTKIDINKTAGTKDVLTSTSVIKLGGTLALNLTGTFAAKDSFKILSATTISGTFGTITPNNPGSGLSWDTTHLRKSGYIIVKGKQAITFNPVPTLFVGEADYDPAATVSPAEGTIVYSSANTSVATIVNGKIHAVAPGTAVITASVTGQLCYRDTTATQTVEVSNLHKQTLTFASIGTKTYGDASFTVTATSDSSLTPVTYTVIEGTDVISMSGNSVTILKSGTAKIRADQAGTATCAPANTWTSLTVNKAPLTITAENKSIIYGETPNYTCTMTGFVNSESVSSLTGSPSYSVTKVSVGTRAITVSAGTLVSDKYSFTFVQGSITIDSATLTITPDNKTITYGTTPVFSYSVSGLVNNEVAWGGSGVIYGGSPVYSVDNYNVGEHAIVMRKGGMGTSNYRLVFNNSGKLTVNKAILDVTAEDKTMTYGDALPSFTFNLAGFVNGDNASVVSGTPDFSSESNPAVGNYSIKATKGSLSANNYDFNFIDGYLTVGNASLTLTADDKTITYGETPVLTYRIEGFVNGDDISDVNGNPDLSVNSLFAGAHTINISSGSLSSANYGFDNQVSGTLTVKKAALKVTAKDTSKVKGSANPVFELAYDGFIGNDNVDSIDVKPIIECSATDTSASGTYPIKVSNGSDNNYEMEYIAGTLTITDNVAVKTISGVEVLFYPNPVVDQLIIAIKGNNQPVTFELYNTSGVKVKTIKSSKDNTSIDMVDLSSGIYTLKMITAQNIFTQQIVKQ
jgi:autotransporter-associated beta strand protein